MEDKNKNIASEKEEQAFIPDSEANPRPLLKFGWGSFRPKCLQFLNNSKWFLCFIILYTIFQAICIMGLSNLTLPSIEKRFSLTGKEMGLIAAANDISALVVVVFISFYGDYGNKVKWIGGGGILLGFGTLLYTLPHFLIGAYEPGHSGARGGLCYNSNGSFLESGMKMKCNMESDSRWYYMAIFFCGQLIMGVGTSPFYSLVPPYLDENVHPKSMPVYLGMWTCATFLGPGIGMAVGGKLLSIYVDIKQPAGVNLTTRDPQWIGAWWLGFLVGGCLILVSSLLVLGFPSELPGARKIRQEHIEKGNIRRANNVKKPSLKMILPELKHLLTNWTFLFNTLGLTSTLLYVGALSPFVPKILQIKFGLNPEDTGYAIASFMTPSMIIGVFIGSVVVKRFSLKEVCKTAALFIFILRAIGVIGPLSFLLPGCKNVNLAGMSSSYNQTVHNGRIEAIQSAGKPSLTASCNFNCQCSMSRFAPVCGSDNVTYFDACHAGCTTKFPNRTFANCSCIPPQTPGSRLRTAKQGYCDRDCKNFLVFVTMIAINIIVQFAKMVPDKTVTLRCVPDNKRAFANGIQYIFMKTLGLLPGPILFGHVVDSSCMLWQNTCGKDGRCFVYDIDSLSDAVCILGTVLTILSTFFYFLSWYLYKPEREEEEKLCVPLQPDDPEKAIDSCKETKV